MVGGGCGLCGGFWQWVVRGGSRWLLVVIGFWVWWLLEVWVAGLGGGGRGGFVGCSCWVDCTVSEKRERGRERHEEKRKN